MRPSSSVCTCIAMVSLLLGCTPNPGGGAGSLETDQEKTLYALGQLLGQNVSDAIAGADLADAELDTVLVGLGDSVHGLDPRVDLDAYGPMVQGFMQVRISEASDAELEASTAFIEEQAAMEGAVRTDSGIVIQELTAGTGAQPEADDIVQVHYHGTLRDGSVFDSSVERGEPATFPLDQVIPCWTEAVQTMRVGGKSRIVCPPDLAYGSSAPPGIPANAVLVFEIELLDIMGQ